MQRHLFAVFLSRHFDPILVKPQVAIIAVEKKKLSRLIRFVDLTHGPQEKRTTKIRTSLGMCARAHTHWILAARPFGQSQLGFRRHRVFAQWLCLHGALSHGTSDGEGAELDRVGRG